MPKEPRTNPDKCLNAQPAADMIVLRPSERLPLPIAPHHDRPPPPQLGGQTLVSELGAGARRGGVLEMSIAPGNSHSSSNSGWWPLAPFAIELLPLGRWRREMNRQRGS